MNRITWNDISALCGAATIDWTKKKKRRKKRICMNRLRLAMILNGTDKKREVEMKLRRFFMPFITSQMIEIKSRLNSSAVVRSSGKSSNRELNEKLNKRLWSIVLLSPCCSHVCRRLFLLSWNQHRYPLVRLVAFWINDNTEDDALCEAGECGWAPVFIFKVICWSAAAHFWYRLRSLRIFEVENDGDVDQIIDGATHLCGF